MTTHTIRRATLTALVFTALAGTALAETQPPNQGPGHRMERDRMERGHDRHGMHHRRQMGGMAHMLGFADMRPGMKIEFSEGRLAFLKAELKITDAQAKAWDAFAAAMRENAAKLNEVFGAADREALAKMNPAERLGWQETALAARLDAVKRSRAAFAPLYAAFSDDQKKTLERLMPSPGARWMAMRERMRQRMEERHDRRGPPHGERHRQQ